MRHDTDVTRHREEVLYDFQVACDRPTAADIADWVGRHPDLADDIRNHAELLLAAAQTRPKETEPSEGLLNRARDRALAAVASARAAAATATFPALIDAAGTSVPRMARELDIGRPVLTDLVQGRMRPPIRRRVIKALAAALGTSDATVQAAADLAAASPQLGHAKASSVPAATPRSFDEIVRDDPTMTAERKAFWLAAED